MDSSAQVSLLLSQAANAFRARLERTMNDAGLHAGQFFLLRALWDRDGLSQAEIAERLDVSPPTINRMVKSLEDAGLVKTKKNRADARVRTVHLTDAGLALRTRALDRWNDLEAEVTSGLTETEALILAQLLEKVRDSLRESGTG